jgi:hypothetical protein
MLGSSHDNHIEVLYHETKDLTAMVKASCIYHSYICCWTVLSVTYADKLAFETKLYYFRLRSQWFNWLFQHPCLYANDYQITLISFILSVLLGSVGLMTGCTQLKAYWSVRVYIYAWWWTWLSFFVCSSELCNVLILMLYVIMFPFRHRHTCITQAISK